MSKQHLDGLAMAARSLESLGLGQGTSNVASIQSPSDGGNCWLHSAAPVQQAAMPVIGLPISLSPA
jgi:hypothetical protein